MASTWTSCPSNGPGIGRRWIRAETYLQDLYIHTFPVSAADWRAWAETAEFIEPLKSRMRQLGITREIQNQLIASASADSGWFRFAALDATVRMGTQLLRSRGMKRGISAQRLLQELFTHISANQESASIIPAEYWFVQPAPPDAEGEAQLFLRGALLLRVRGRKSASAIASESPEQVSSPDLLAALNEPPRKPAHELLKLLFANGRASAFGAGILAVLAAGAVVIQALVFWFLFN